MANKSKDVKIDSNITKNQSEHTVNGTGFLLNKKFFMVNTLGFSFFLLHAWYSYFFYHVNSYKLFTLGIIVSVLWILSFFTKTSKETDLNTLKLFGLLALPVIITLPGMLMHQMNYNYYFPIEFASKVFLILWSCYILVHTIQSDSTDAIMFWIRVTIFYVSLYAVLGRYSLNPLESGEFLSGNIISRNKSTFGNVNYFAAFMITVMPVLIIPFFGEIFKNRVNIESHSAATGILQKITVFLKSTIYSIKNNKFASISILASIMALVFTGTRSAQVSFILALIFCILIFVVSQLSRKKRSVIYLLALLGATAGIIILLLGIIYNDDIVRYLGKSNRYLDLLTKQGWVNRLYSWYTAWVSIIDSPFWGYGLGSSYSLFFEFVLPEIDLYNDEKSYNHVHNELLEYTQEAGIIGFIILFCVILFFFVRLFGIAKNKGVDIKTRTIALSCMIGILAFYLHGIFSVAQRMIVANSGLYTVLGISFYLIIKFGDREGNFLFLKTNITKSISSLFTTKLPLKLPVIYLTLFLPLIVSAWYVFYLWSSPFLLSNEYKKQRRSMSEFLAYAENARNDPSVYVLHEIIGQELRFKRFNDAAKTGKVILSVIPHFRNLETQTAKAELYNGNQTEAKKYIKLSDQRSTYTPEKNILQMYLALKINDRAMFNDAIEKYFVQRTFRSYYPLKNFKAISLEIVPKKDAPLFSVELEKDGTKIDYHQTNKICNVRSDNVTAVKFRLSSEFYDELSIIVNSPRGNLQNAVNRFRDKIRQAINYKQLSFNLQICPELAEDEKNQILGNIQQFEQKKNNLLQLENNYRNLQKNANRQEPSYEETQEKLKNMSENIGKLNTDILRLDFQLQGKSNYFLYKNEVLLTTELNNIVNYMLGHFSEDPNNV